MPRQLGTVWDHFFVVNEEIGKKNATCNYCSAQYQMGTAPRLRMHLLKCKRCPEEVRREYLEEYQELERHRETKSALKSPSSASFSTSNHKTKSTEIRRSSLHSESEEVAHSPPRPPSEHSFASREPKPQFLEVLEEPSKVEQTRKHPDKCENEIFGNYVASELRQLRFDHSRRKLKRLIQKAILNVAQEDDEL